MAYYIRCQWCIVEEEQCIIIIVYRQFMVSVRSVQEQQGWSVLVMSYLTWYLRGQFDSIWDRWSVLGVGSGAETCSGERI